jgi:hypothetical protein
MNLSNHTLFAAAIAGVATGSLGQTPGIQPAALPVETPRERLEATFQSELRKIHVPLLADYVNRLKEMAALSRSSEATVAIQKELEWAQHVIEAGGVVDLAVAASELQPDPHPAAAAAAGMPDMTRPPLELAPGDSHWVGEPPSPASAGSAPELTSTGMHWRLDSLEPGEWDVFIQYAAPELKEHVEMEVSLGGELQRRRLDPSRATEAGDRFRVFRIGRISHEADSGPLELSLAKTGGEGMVLVKMVVLQKARPRPAP